METYKNGSKGERNREDTYLTNKNYLQCSELIYIQHLIGRRSDSMKKHLFIFTYIAIGLAHLAGCSNYGNSISTVGIENTITQTDSSQNNDTTSWKPTAFEAVNNFDGVTMNVKEETASSTKLTVVFENKSSSQCIFGEYFSLEKKLNGKWYQVPVAISGNYGFNTIGYKLATGETRELAVDWKWLYGSLDAGEYRIVKDIMDFRGTGDYDNYYLAAEFSIN